MANPDNRTVTLHEIAHSREGDKGNWATISLICYSPEFYPIVRQQITADVVQSAFAHRGAKQVDRYELPKLHAMNFVLHDVLEGGVNSSLCLDGHGKTLSFHLLSIELEVPAELLAANGRTH